MNFIKKYQKYFTLILLSIIIGLFRWVFLGNEYTLLSKPKIILEAFVDFQKMKGIVEQKLFPIIDARDIESFNEGHIENAINIDIDYLYDNDKELMSNINNMISKYGYLDNKIIIDDDSFYIKDINNDNQQIVVYCWSPSCDRAEEVISLLLDTSEYFGSFGKYLSKNNFSIYRGGWDEWDSLYLNKD